MHSRASFSPWGFSLSAIRLYFQCHLTFCCKYSQLFLAFMVIVFGIPIAWTCVQRLGALAQVRRGFCHAWMKTYTVIFLRGRMLDRPQDIGWKRVLSYVDEDLYFHISEGPRTGSPSRYWYIAGHRIYKILLKGLLHIGVMFILFF